MMIRRVTILGLAARVTTTDAHRRFGSPDDDANDD